MEGSLLSVLLICLTAVAVGFANVRWFRVAQREHYLGGSVLNFAKIWWTNSLINILLLILMPVALLIGSKYSLLLLLMFVSPIVGPVGLGLRGRTSKLVWTKRMKTIAVLSAALQILALAYFAFTGSLIFGAFVLTLLPFIFIEFALWALEPVEKRKAKVFVDLASSRLRSVKPTIVAITGSYGKTSTKGYVAHLLSGVRNVLPTPASFNNKAGLSRAINEHLNPGVEVFVAEMGTYGVGEIKELCNFVIPDIAVITAIGPVHLERFGTEENIVTAKAEIFEKASICVVNIDDIRLEKLANDLAAQGKKVWRCGQSKADSDVDSNSNSDVSVVSDGTSIHIFHDQNELAVVDDPGVPLTNLACAIAVALELGISPEHLIARIPTLPTPAHRQEVTTNERGVVVIDDTYNANPAGVQRGLQLLTKVGDPNCRRVVVTPGMVELGPRQDEENELFARLAASVITDFIVVGRTNRKALLRGVRGAAVNAIVVDRLPQAVAWVKENTSTGDAVLYANDLPDHFS